MNVRWGKMIILVALIGLVVTDIDAVRGSSGGASRGGGARSGGGGGSRGGSARMSSGSGRSRSTGVTKSAGRSAGTGRAVGRTGTRGTGTRVTGTGVRSGARVGSAGVHRGGARFAGARGGRYGRYGHGRYGRGWGRHHGYGYRYAAWGALALGSAFWLSYRYPDYYYRYYKSSPQACRFINGTDVELLVAFGDIEGGLRLPPGEILYVPCGSGVLARSAVGEGMIEIPSVDAETIIGSDTEGFYVY